MYLELIEVKGEPVWLAIDNNRVVSTDKKTIEETGELVCYFKFSMPGPFILGEIFRDAKGIPIFFSTVADAVDYAKQELVNKI